LDREVVRLAPLSHARIVGVPRAAVQRAPLWVRLRFTLSQGGLPRPHV